MSLDGLLTLGLIMTIAIIMIDQLNMRIMKKLVGIFHPLHRQVLSDLSHGQIYPIGIIMCK